MKSVNVYPKEKFSLNPVACTNQIVTEAINGVIREAFEYFLTITGKRNRENERYFYNMDEVNTLFSMFDNPQYRKIRDRLILKEIYEGGEFFCYEVSLGKS